MKLLPLVSFALLVVPVSPVLAQTQGQAAAPARPADGLSVTGSLRVRGEVLRGQARAGLGAQDDVVSQRALIAIEYRSGAWRIGGELQDARVHGADAGSAINANDVNTLEPVQAYVGWTGRDLFGSGTRVEVLAGRQTLNIGSRRLVAADEYRNTTNGYTGLKAEMWLPDQWRATTIYVLPQQRLPDRPADVADNRSGLDRESFDQRLWGATVWRDALIGPVLGEASFYRFDERDSAGRPTRDRRLNTAGLRFIRAAAAGKIDGELEALFQWGRASDGLAQSALNRGIYATFWHIDGGYSIAGSLRARVSVEYDRASGDAPGGRNGRFDTLFGMRRADLAPAGIYGQVGRANIRSLGVRLEIQPSPRFDAFAAWRTLDLAEATDAFSVTGVRDASGRSGDHAGQQVDGRLRWWAVPGRLRIEANATWLGKGRFLRDAPNANPAGNVRYVALAATWHFGTVQAR